MIRKYAAMSLGVAVMAGALGCHGSDPYSTLDAPAAAVPSGWNAIEAPALGMSFAAPADYRPPVLDRELIAAGYHPDPNERDLVNAGVTPGPQNLTDIWFSLEENEGIFSLDQMVKEARGLKDHSLVDGVRSEHLAVELVETGSGRAVRIKKRLLQREGDVQLLYVYLWLRPSHVFMMVLASNEVDWPANEALFQQIANTVRIHMPDPKGRERMPEPWKIPEDLRRVIVQYEPVYVPTPQRWESRPGASPGFAPYDPQVGVPSPGETSGGETAGGEVGTGDPQSAGGVPAEGEQGAPAVNEPSGGAGGSGEPGAGDTGSGGSGAGLDGGSGQGGLENPPLDPAGSER